MNIILLIVGIKIVYSGRYSRFSREIIGSAARRLALVLVVPFLLQISAGMFFASIDNLKSEDDWVRMIKVLATVELVSVTVCIALFWVIFLRIAQPIPKANRNPKTAASAENDT